MQIHGERGGKKKRKSRKVYRKNLHQTIVPLKLIRLVRGEKTNKKKKNTRGDMLDRVEVGVDKPGPHRLLSERRIRRKNPPLIFLKRRH